MNFSVAIATYNGARYLREQLDSIRRQSLLPVEVVICDDGSSDDTLDVARRFAADAPFKVMIDPHGLRLGFSANFVRAIGHCTGEIVALCDQDDVWDERKLAVSAAEFADKSVTLVSHCIRVVDQDLNPTSMVMPPAFLRGRHTVVSIDPWYCPNGMQLLFRRTRITPWLTETPPLSAYGCGNAPFDEWIFYLGLLAGTVVIVEEILGVWRRHVSATTRALAKIKEEESAAHNLQLALRSGADAYLFRAEVFDSRAEFAERPVALPDGGRIQALDGAAGHYRGMSRMFHRRARLHDPKSSFPKRLLTFGKMAAQKDYRSRNRGGLGAKAVLKDLFTICFGPRLTVEPVEENTARK